MISSITFSYSLSVMKISGHTYFTITILTIWDHVTFKWQQGSVVVELDWSHSIARPQNIQMATRVGCGGIRLVSFNSPSQNSLSRRKGLEDISYRIRIIALLSQILFPWQKGSVLVNCHWQHLMAQLQKRQYRRKDLADISNRSRVMPIFRNFVGSIRWPNPENPTIEGVGKMCLVHLGQRVFCV